MFRRSKMWEVYPLKVQGDIDLYVSVNLALSKSKTKVF